MMDEQRQRRVNEAAEQLADASRASYQVVAERGGQAQALNAELTQELFNQVINNLRVQAADTREMTQALAEQQQRGQEASQVLTKASVGAYMDFVNSMFRSTRHPWKRLREALGRRVGSPHRVARPPQPKGAGLSVCLSPALFLL